MNNKKTYEIETCHSLDAYITTTYKLTEEDLENYIVWCEDKDYDVDKETNLIEYLQTNGDGIEELTVKNTWFENSKGGVEILAKCKQLNDNKRCKTEVS